ncbi:hypothetical protein ANCCEY_13538 [Ancylostoma ceylanicum]|uniref:DUF5641 domain-containing protein n=1 Tax=Ancylostoma ceylanicum TaxID=53326 RepID=A0A0D6L6T8_9BILA|nr:hypothetical protein ANCCEY_13538 [Ancylostoma ceylanicum]
MAYRRLESLQRQLTTSSEVKSWYNKILNEYFEEGIIERVNDQIEGSAGIYYMPHSVEQKLLPRGQWIYGKIEELIKSADGMIRSAKILMPNHKILQRPLNKIYPLEIRPVPDPLGEENPPNMEHDSQDPPPTRSRIHVARESKSRALGNIREFEADLDRSVTPTSGSSSVSSFVMAMLALLVIDPAAAQVNDIRCYNGTVFIIPPKGKFELCFNQECRTFNGINEEMKLALPTSPLPHAVGVKIRWSLHNELISAAEWCEPPDTNPSDYEYYSNTWYTRANAHSNGIRLSAQLHEAYCRNDM